MPGQTWLAMGAGQHREAIGWQESNRSQGAKAFLPPQMAEHGARAIESEYRMCLIQTDPILCFRFGALAGGRGTPERRLQAERQRNSAGCGASIEENTQGQVLTNPAG